MPIRRVANAIRVTPRAALRHVRAGREQPAEAGEQLTRLLDATANDGRPFDFPPGLDTGGHPPGGAVR